MKSRVFVGSSSESLPAAKAIQANLDRDHPDIEVTLWNQGIFEPSILTVQALQEVLTKFDFGVFVFGADDVTVIRNTSYQTTRDNVVFELGLFIGAFGLERNYIIKPRGIKDLHLPTDLLGVTTLDYVYARQDTNRYAALDPACEMIAQAIGRLGPREKLREMTVSKSSSKAGQEQADFMDDDDISNMLSDWFQKEVRAIKGGDIVINYDNIESKLQLPEGSAARLIEPVAQSYSYTVLTKGPTTMRLRYDFTISI